ncbi:MAG: type II secretion system F family protein [Desulfobacterales bacterium]|nr:type II secretion system F family protein [Desulfobacterales bacterium]MDD4392845.1 type II secretion system F family protein [Desulfobacterales bacterium]
MTQFAYRAINENGASLTGMVDAESVDAANAQLAARGYIPVKITAKSGPSARGGGKKMGGLFNRPVTTRDLILFTQQFRTMTRAGIPILDILDILEAQTENAGLKKIMAAMHQDIKEGCDLSEAFKKHPKAFSPLYCSMIQAGETAGSLPAVLGRLVYIIEHEHKVKSDIKAALRYPMIVVIALGVAFFVLLTFVIPKFVTIFIQAGLDLPLPTRICLELYRFLENYWFGIIAALAAGLAALIAYCKTDQGKYVRDGALMRIPLMGPLFIKSAMSRFSAIFSILQHSGVSVIQAMQILAGTIGNAAIAREFTRIREKLEEGRGISEPLKSARYFTPMVVSMVAIGEDTGNLDELLQEVSEHYDTEVEYAVKQLSDAIGPILIVGLAAVVGFFALAIFLPMWDLTKMVK